jgi:ribonuclease VapC
VATPEAAPASVLDASALLALIQDEAGASDVEEAVAAGAAISSVNFAEVLTKLGETGTEPGTAATEIARAIAGARAALRIEPFVSEDAIETARLRPHTRASGLSLADRACLALAARYEVPALTTDRSWSGLTEVGVAVQLIR